MKKGQTIFEMLLIIAFMGIAFVAILQLLVTNLAVERDTEGSLVAMHLASGKMEELLAANFNTISSEATAEVSGFSSYSRQVEVASLEAALKDLKVRIYWNQTSYLLQTQRNNY